MLPYAQTIFTYRNTTQTIDMTYISVTGNKGTIYRISTMACTEPLQRPVFTSQKAHNYDNHESKHPIRSVHHNNKSIFNQYSSTLLAQKASTVYSPALEESLLSGLSESLAKQN